MCISQDQITWYKTSSQHPKLIKAFTSSLSHSFSLYFLLCVWCSACVPCERSAPEGNGRSSWRPVLPMAWTERRNIVCGPGAQRLRNVSALQVSLRAYFHRWLTVLPTPQSRPGWTQTAAEISVKTWRESPNFSQPFRVGNENTHRETHTPSHRERQRQRDRRHTDRHTHAHAHLGVGEDEVP